MNNVAKLECLLFAEGAELKKRDILKLLNIDANQLATTASTLRQVLSGHGIALVESDTTLALRSAPEMSEFLREVHEESLQGDVGKAALETLSILLYRGPSTRSEVDYIRGVNSSSTIRALLVRGLIERERGSSGYVYKPTVDALALLGVQQESDIPDIDRIRGEIGQLEQHEQ